MFKDRVHLLESLDKYKDCFFLLTSNDGSIGFCLKFKLWNEPCPPRCALFTPDKIGSLEEAQSKKYDIDCIDFTRIDHDKDQTVYYCNLYRQKEPLCQSCGFHRYDSDPFNPKSLT